MWFPMWRLSVMVLAVATLAQVSAWPVFEEGRDGWKKVPTLENGLPYNMLGSPKFVAPRPTDKHAIALMCTFIQDTPSLPNVERSDDDDIMPNWERLYSDRSKDVADCCQQEENEQELCVETLRQKTVDQYCFFWKNSPENQLGINDPCCEETGEARVQCMDQARYGFDVDIHDSDRTTELMQVPVVEEVKQMLMMNMKPHAYDNKFCEWAKQKTYPDATFAEATLQTMDPMQKMSEVTRKLISCCDSDDEATIDRCLTSVREDSVDEVCTKEKILKTALPLVDPSVLTEAPAGLKALLEYSKDIPTHPCCQRSHTNRYSCFSQEWTGFKALRDPYDHADEIAKYKEKVELFEQAVVVTLKESEDDDDAGPICDYWTGGQAAAKPDGVLTLFQTNTEEFQHAPMTYNSSNPVPAWLEGTLVQSAPAMYDLGGRSVNHIFDGLAKVHSVAIGQHGMNFSAAFLNTSAYTRSKKANTYAPAITFFGVNPPFSPQEKLKALGYPMDNNNANVCKFGHGESSAYAALADAWFFAKFNLDNLASLGVSNPEVSGVHMSPLASSSAHPIAEPGTTNLFIDYIMIPGLRPGEKQQYYVVRIKSLTEIEVLANFQTEKASYMHSFALTENYAVFFALPAYFDYAKIVDTARMSEALEWLPKTNTTIFLANLKSGKIETIQTDAVFYFHHANAYETDDGKVVVDVSAFGGGPSMLSDYKLQVLRNISLLHKVTAKSRLYRYTIDIVKKSVQTKIFRSESPIQDFLHKIEFPSINENYRARHYCYLYGVVLDWTPSNPLNGAYPLVKKNLCADGDDLFWYRPNHFVSEASFVANPNGKDEDDGVLLSSVFDADRGTNYLLILDAKTMKAINTAYMPTYIPAPLHSEFFLRQ